MILKLNQKKYKEILFDLIEESFSDEIIDYLIRKYDKKINSTIIQIDFENIEKEENNKYYIILIFGIIGILIGLYLIKKCLRHQKA